MFTHLVITKSSITADALELILWRAYDGSAGLKQVAAQLSHRAAAEDVLSAVARNRPMSDVWTLS